MWLGDSQYRLAGSLLTLIAELEAAYPDQEWQTSAGTGTIGDAAHRAEGSASDHNPWLNNTVRALDVAKTANGPDCEALFRMVNAMYGAKDPRVFPYGYAIFNGRITDWDNPGGFHAQVGDQHLTHCHISVGQSGYNATNPWPITSTGELTMDAAAAAAIAGVKKDVADLDGRVGAVLDRLTALFGVDLNGDGKVDVTGNVQGAVRAELAGVVKLLADMAPRVAETQANARTIAAGVTALGKAVAAIAAPTAVVNVQAIADAFVAKIKPLSWKVG